LYGYESWYGAHNFLNMNDSFENSPQKKVGSGPKTRVCYVCGRQYGLHSFEIHLKQCKELWIAREAEKDPRERKKLPEDPMLRFSAGGGSEGSSPMPTAKELEEINKLSTVAFNTEALDTCAYCGRTFLPEKLVIHNRSCTAENPARKLADGVRRGNTSSAVSTPAATPNKADSTAGTPIRPTTGSRPRPSSITRSSKDASSERDDVANLRVEDGNLVGHLGGSSGRPLRNSRTPPGAMGIASPTQGSSRPASTTLSTGDVFNVSDFRDKEEVIEYLTRKLDNLENIATDLARAIIDVRTVVEQLR
jgi:hypothetical protein